MLKKTTVFLFVVCLFINMPFARALSDKVYKELSIFSRVLEIVDKMYVEPVDEKAIIKGSIDGMLATLDPHTVYLPAKIYKNFSSDTKGRFGGVGIEVSVRDGVLTIISPLRDTPAWAAGIKANDRILAIDGKSTKDMTLGEAVLMMRGPIGKKLALTLWRQGKTKEVTLEREVINVPGMEFKDLGEGYVMVRVTTFQEGVSKKVKKEIERFRKENPDQLKGIILDLRDNPGGLLNEAVKISDYFLEKGVIVSTKGRDKKRTVNEAHGAGALSKVPMVMLINGGSASASEIVAGALGDNNRAKLMGTKSFGKGSVQTVVNLDGGDAVKITIAYYYTPKDKLIDGKGITPDIILDQKAYKKKNKIKTDDKDLKLTRDEYDKFQEEEALAYLKKMAH
ncbi:MAG: S41 family peptidase [Deltaproteobacteria bacterium]|nr:S41 family peptidase [Deltaproteobacteria bacterium]